MVKVNEKDARLICECLNIAKQYLEESTPANEPTKAAINKKINDIYELIKKIEKYAGYDFFKQIDKCSKKRSDDIAEEAMILSSRKWPKKWY